jgi:hypothetical protein
MVLAATVIWALVTTWLPGSDNLLNSLPLFVKTLSGGLIIQSDHRSFLYLN